MSCVLYRFLCELDNAAYSFGLPEALRAQVEECGRRELDATQSAALARTKGAYFVAVVFAVLLTVALFTTSSGGIAGIGAIFVGTPFCFWCASVLDLAIGGSGGAKQIAQGLVARTLWATASFLFMNGMQVIQ